MSNAVQMNGDANGRGERGEGDWRECKRVEREKARTTKNLRERKRRGKECEIGWAWEE